jgi:hypothetical protein
VVNLVQVAFLAVVPATIRTKVFWIQAKVGSGSDRNEVVNLACGLFTPFEAGWILNPLTAFVGALQARFFIDQGAAIDTHNCFAKRTLGKLGRPEFFPNMIVAALGCRFPGARLRPPSGLIRPVSLAFWG